MAAPTITITWADVVAVAPALASVPPTTQDVVIADVKGRMLNGLWGDRANMAAKYLAAHLAAMSLRSANGPVGAVTDATVDKISRGFTGPTDPDDYDATPWGVQYKRIRDQIFRVPVVASFGHGWWL